jgi:hypothetical protein
MKDELEVILTSEMPSTIVFALYKSKKSFKVKLINRETFAYNHLDCIETLKIEVHRIMSEQTILDEDTTVNLIKD